MNPIPSSLPMASMIILPLSTLSIRFIDVNMLAIKPFVVRSIEVSVTVIEMKPWKLAGVLTNPRNI